MFDEEGRSYGATVIEASPCVVTQVKTEEKDGYAAVQVGFRPTSERKLTKPVAGQLKKAGVEPFAVLREFREESDNSTEGIKVGDTITVEQFRVGDRVSV